MIDGRIARFATVDAVNDHRLRLPGSPRFPEMAPAPSAFRPISRNKRYQDDRAFTLTEHTIFIGLKQLDCPGLRILLYQRENFLYRAAAPGEPSLRL